MSWPPPLRVVLDAFERPAWQERAACLATDPALFYAEVGESNAEAKTVCQGCAVRGDCLEYALANGEAFGIWGGLSIRERQCLRRARRLQLMPAKRR